MRKFEATLIGFVVIFLAIFVFNLATASSFSFYNSSSRALSNTFSFLAFSIICTAGISLVIYIPLAMGIGTLILKAFNRNRVVVDSNISQKMTLTNDQKALFDYIKQASHVGMSKEEISANLKEKGWKDEDINKSWEFFEKDPGK